MHKVTSEIYAENDRISEKLDSGSEFCVFFLFSLVYIVIFLDFKI